MRLFVAIELPERARAAVAARVAVVRDRLPPASWAPTETLHLTLLFLGEVEPDRVARLTGALSATVGREARFVAELGGAGAFPARGPLRVVWLGLGPRTPLDRLAAAARRAADSVGAPYDTRPFSSHVTLARCRWPWPASLRGQLVELDRHGAGGFEVAAVRLMASELGSGGARHTCVAALPLGVAA